MWNKIVKKQDEIVRIFNENGFTTGTLIQKRIKKGFKFPLRKILS